MPAAEAQPRDQRLIVEERLERLSVDEIVRREESARGETWRCSWGRTVSWTWYLTSPQRNVGFPRSSSRPRLRMTNRRSNAASVGAKSVCPPSER